MTAYATVTEAEGFYGARLISSVCDRDDDGVVDTASFERQLAVATQQMDGYLLGRYPLPLSPTYLVPDIFAKVCTDIAVYNSAHDGAVRSAEMRLRFEDAIAYMTKIARNEIKLPLAKPATADDPMTVINKSQEASTTAGRAILATCPYRQFTPENLRRIL